MFVHTHTHPHTHKYRNTNINNASQSQVSRVAPALESKSKSESKSITWLGDGDCNGGCKQRETVETKETNRNERKKDEIRKKTKTNFDS